VSLGARFALVVAVPHFLKRSSIWPGKARHGQRRCHGDPSVFSFGLHNWDQRGRFPDL